MNQKMPGAVIVWQCKHCTWFRAKHDSPEWDREEIEHLVYGRIKQGDLFKLETQDHNCEMTALRRIHHGIPPKITYKQPYKQREENG